MSEPDSERANPLRVALVNDYEIIVRGLASMLAPFASRVAVVELDVAEEPNHEADVALFDTFGGRRNTLERARDLVQSRHVGAVVLYTWDAPSQLLQEAERIGVAGIVDKSRSGADLVNALEQVVSGTRVGFDRPAHNRSRGGSVAAQLTNRELEVLAMIALGLTNREIADQLFLSVDTVKTYVRRLYTKLGVRNRPQAAVRASEFEVSPPIS